MVTSLTLDLKSSIDKFSTNLGRIPQLIILVDFPPSYESRAETLEQITADKIRGWAHLFPDLLPYVNKYGPREGYWRWFRSLRKKLRKLLYQQLLVFLITSYEVFIEDVLRAVFRQDPRYFMTSQKTVTWEQIIEFGNYDSLIEHLISEKITEVNSGNWQKVVDAFKKLFDIDLASHIDMRSMAEVFEIRHAIVHNLGMTDKKLLNKIGPSKWGIEYKLNYEIQLTEKLLEQITTFIQSAAVTIQRSLLIKLVISKPGQVETSQTLDEEFIKIEACAPEKCPFCGGKERISNIMLVAPKVDEDQGYWVEFYCIPCDKMYESNGIIVRESKLNGD
jgi:hypothetical protein